MSMTALYTMDDKIYIGKSENYDNKGHYDNSDNSLLYVSDCHAAFTFLSSEGCTDTQEEALNRGIYTKEDYEEFSRITDFSIAGRLYAGKGIFLCRQALFPASRYAGADSPGNQDHLLHNQ
mgnify:CR=1 FL=1